MKIRKAVIPVAGLGTRFLPATKAVPKELLPVVDKPTIHYIVEEAHLSGIDEIIFVTASGKEAIEEYFGRSVALERELEKKKDYVRLQMIRDIAAMVNVSSVIQENPLGLGHAVLCAKDLVGDEPFAVLLGDDMFDAKIPAPRQLMEAFEQCGRAVVGVFRVPDDQTHLYGIVDPASSDGRLHKLRGMVEKPAGKSPSNLAIIGPYVFGPDIFECIERTKPGSGGEIQLTDAMNLLNDREDGGVFAYELQGTRHDAGNIFGFLEANIAYGMKDPELKEKLLSLFRSYTSGE